MNKLFVVLAIFCLASQAFADATIGLYYADWARYRKAPYKYDAKNLASIVTTVNHVYYGFSFFCPPSDQPSPYWYSTDC